MLSSLFRLEYSFQLEKKSKKHSYLSMFKSVKVPQGNGFGWADLCIDGQGPQPGPRLSNEMLPLAVPFKVDTTLPPSRKVLIQYDRTVSGRPAWIDTVDRVSMYGISLSAIIHCKGQFSLFVRPEQSPHRTVGQSLNVRPTSKTNMFTLPIGCERRVHSPVQFRGDKVPKTSQTGSASYNHAYGKVR